MNIDWVEDWFKRKLDVADSIVATHGESSTPDAEILLCCAISALAAKMWPGTGKDKRRFIQFLVDFTPESFKVTRVSIPILIAKKKREHPEVVEKIVRHFYSFPQLEILDGERVDQNEQLVLDTVRGLALPAVRDSSYVGIIYSDLRSGLIHEYRMGPFMHAWGMSPRDDIPSYVNFGKTPDRVVIEQFAAQYHVGLPEAEAALVERERHIYFPYTYLREALDGAANEAFAYWRASADFEKSVPNPWWIG